MAEFTSKRLAELKAVAEAATGGTWRATEPQEWGDDEKLQSAVMVSEGETLTWDDHGGEVFHPADATFISTFDPPTTLALIAALKAERDEARAAKRSINSYLRLEREAARQNLHRAERAEAALERVREAADKTVTVEKIAQVIRYEVISTVGVCVCGEGYTIRNMRDPYCEWHSLGESFAEDTARAVHALLTEEEA